MNFIKLSPKIFFNLLSENKIMHYFNLLEEKQKALLEGIADRLSFYFFVEQNYLCITNFINPKFIRSLQGYLLLSCGDALGSGTHFYSFKDFVEEHRNFERNNLAISYKNFTIKDENDVINILKNFIRIYIKKQSVKHSFFTFWHGRSHDIKEKILFCYLPFSNKELKFNEELFSEIIRQFYEIYRNPFTHAAQNNFPQVIPDLGNFYIPNLAKAVIWIEYHRSDEKVFQFRVPLTFHEAEKILSTNGNFYLKLHDQSLIPLPRPNNPQDLVRISIESRGAVPDKNKNGQDIYVHPGTLDVMRMAIAEACAERLTLKINWENLYD